MYINPFGDLPQKLKKCSASKSLKSHEGFVKVQECLQDMEFKTQKEGDVLLGGDSQLTFGRLTVFKDGQW